MSAALPGAPGPKLSATWSGMDANKQAALRPHLLGATSADYLAGWLARNGTPVSASTLRTYRRSLTTGHRVTP